MNGRQDDTPAKAEICSCCHVCGDYVWHGDDAHSNEPYTCSACVATANLLWLTSLRRSGHRTMRVQRPSPATVAPEGTVAIARLSVLLNLIDRLDG